MKGEPAFQPRAVVVTGGAGFIGSNLVRWILHERPETGVVVLDALTYAGNVESIADLVARHGPAGDGRLYFVRGDIRDTALATDVFSGNAIEPESGRPLPIIDAVLHLAAESHVDRSILGPAEFVSTNVQGTLSLLEAVRASLATTPREFRFVNVSTDEVYGTLALDDPPFTEDHPLAPNSPYSASKAAADCFVRAYGETFGVPCITTRCSNNYGPYQFPEKLIPLMITRALAGQALPVYGDGLNVRDWLHVNDHASAIWRACEAGRVGAVYNIGGNAERRNIDIVKAILDELGRPHSLIQFVPDRPGHDRRYAMNITRIAGELGWRPVVAFEDGLRDTIRWYLGHRGWWQRIQSEAYRATRSLYLTSEVA